MVEEIRDEFIEALLYPSELVSQNIKSVLNETNYREKIKDSNINRISVDLKLDLSWKEAIVTDKKPMENLKELLKFIGRCTLPVPIYRLLVTQWIRWKSAAG
jgi:hypothetical protein